MITVRLDSAKFAAGMSKVVSLVEHPRSVTEAAARSVRRDLQRHFRVRDQQANALGGRRTHWWSNVARSTQIASVDDQQAVIHIGERGIALKVYGGAVRPVKAKALTIPIHAEAHGRRARTVELITGQKLWRFQPRKGGPTFLVRTMGDDKLRLLYVLKSSATMKPDPQALPDQAVVDANALFAAEKQASSILRRGGGQSVV